MTDQLVLAIRKGDMVQSPKDLNLLVSSKMLVEKRQLNLAIAFRPIVQPLPDKNANYRPYPHH